MLKLTRTSCAPTRSVLPPHTHTRPSRRFSVPHRPAASTHHADSLLVLSCCRSFGSLLRLRLLLLLLLLLLPLLGLAGAAGMRARNLGGMSARSALRNVGRMCGRSHSLILASYTYTSFSSPIPIPHSRLLYLYLILVSYTYAALILVSYTYASSRTSTTYACSYRFY